MGIVSLAEDERRRAQEASVEQTLRRVYAELTGANVAISTLARVDAITRPVARPVQDKDIPLRIDWTQMARDVERADALMRLWNEERELRAAIEDEDDLLMMLQ